ncbi:MAG: glycoside hydrolase family 95-like protein, partial [Bacteroidia bacterium]
FKDGDHAMTMVKMLLRPTANGSSGSYVNLFDAHPPFQIDGNFGAAAGIGELLVQSHEAFIEILPALPTAIPFGEVNGICTRGGFDLNIKWDKGLLKALEVTSKVGGECKLRYKNRNVIIDTKAGETYRLNAELEVL